MLMDPLYSLLLQKVNDRCKLKPAEFTSRLQLYWKLHMSKK